MKLNEEELFPGEGIALERRANALINYKDYGLEKFKYNLFQKKEAIGGKLYVTNCRLIFKAHAFNRIHGTYSILFPTITSVRDSSVLLMKKIEIVSNGKPFEFVVGGRSELLTVIEKMRQTLPTEEKERMTTILSGQEDGFRSFREMDEIIDIIFKLI